MFLGEFTKDGQHRCAYTLKQGEVLAVNKYDEFSFFLRYDGLDKVLSSAFFSVSDGKKEKWMKVFFNKGIFDLCEGVEMGAQPVGKNGKLLTYFHLSGREFYVKKIRSEIGRELFRNGEVN